VTRPGVTRDRIVSLCKLGNYPFEIIDTGGIGANVDASFTGQVRAEVEIALAAADVLVFVVDGQDGLTPLDLELAQLMRRTAKPLLLAVNKIDVDQHVPRAAEFSSLGFENQLAISAEHNRGILPLVAWIERLLPPPVHAEAAAAQAAPIKIAIVGRPNVGKSSLTNAILADDRTLVSPISGTTRDAIDIPYERHGNRYVLIDTAGIRPRSKVDNSVEVFSVMRSETSIRRADLCCLVIDATMGVTAQDKKIAGMIQEANKPCVVALNKWDLIKDRTEGKEALKEVLEEMRSELFFIPYAPTMLVSAKTGAELTRLFKTIERIRTEAQFRIGTVGKPVYGVEVMIASDGEILTRGPHVMKGYYNKPEATREAIDGDGWFHTGDIGELRDGFLAITDRKKDIIVTAGGKKIAPQPIENALKTNKYISQAVVIGDKRKFPVVLVVPNWEQLEKWAKIKNLLWTDRSQLLEMPIVHAKIEKEVFGKLHGLAKFETPKKVALLEHDFSIERGELTPTLKVKRRVIDRTYHDVIDRLYEDEHAAA